MDIEQEIAVIVAVGDGAQGWEPTDADRAVAARLMPLIRRAQAEALREAADSDEVLAHYVDTESRDFNRGVDHGADEVFDRLIQRADRIEQEAGE